MLKYPVPENEEKRLQALLDLHILDTPPEERFDAITRIAQRLFDVETVTITLIDAERQWFKSRQGMAASETPRAESICAHAILGDDILNVHDASKDFRFQDFPCVKGSPYIRLYVGCPLKAVNGENLGTLCLIHSKPRSLNDVELDTLKDLASLVEYNLNSKALNESLERSLKIEKALKEKELIYRNLVDSTADSIIVLSSAGNIQSFNNASEKIFGYSSQEAVDKNISLLFPSYHEKELNALIKTDPENEDALSTPLLDILCQRNDGSEFSGELTRSHMVFEDNDLYIWILRDTTERKQLEVLKNEFISNVSHELRTPMTAIRGALGLVLGPFKESLNEQAKKLIETAHTNCERLVRLVNDILDIEKIEAGKMSLNLEKLEISAVVKSAVEANQAFAQQYSIEVVIENLLPPSFVNADNDRLIQVLTNLLSNAIKYSPTGGVVKVRLERFKDKIKVSVIDKGPGIPLDFQSKLFGKFVQVESSSKRSKEGTGLGLSISKAIIEKFGGEIHLESQVGVGSTFYFLLDEV